jgi:hypothetical protein
VAQIKLKMAYLIWLLRGIPDYVKCLFEEYGYWREQGKRGFIEFKFYYWPQLFNAIDLIEKLTPYQETSFVGMPGTPSYTPPGAKLPSLPLRRIPSKDCADFHEVRFSSDLSPPHFASLRLPKSVQHYMRFTEDHQRPNLQRALNVAMESEDLFVISVSVMLEGTYSANLYDFLYRSICWQPSDKGPAAAVPIKRAGSAYRQ